jgi:hypothetical protein
MLVLTRGQSGLWSSHAYGVRFWLDLEKPGVAHFVSLTPG